MITPAPAARRHLIVGCAAAVVWMAASSALWAQESNLARLRLCAAAIADSVLQGRGLNDTLQLHVAAHPADWLLQEATLEVAQRRGVTVRPWTDDAEPVITLAITAIGVEYRPTDDDDSLERVARIEVSASMPDMATDGATMLARSFSAALLDTFDADRRQDLGTSGYEFARAAMNDAPKRGFWDSIVEPLVVLGSAVVMVVLLFTVRSQ